MKKLLLIVGLVLGMSASVQAMSYITVNSTAVCFGTATAGGGPDYRVMEVRTSSANATNNSIVAVLIDSNSLSLSQTNFERPDRQGVKIATQNISIAPFTVGQYVVPPWQSVTVATASNNGSTAQPVPNPNVVNIGGQYGYTPRNGTCVVLDGGVLPTYISIGIEQIPSGSKTW